MRSECVPCLLKRCQYEADLIDESKKVKVTEEALRLLDKYFEEGVVSAEVATHVHGRVYEILDTDDPYSELKEKSNEAAENLLPKAEEFIKRSEGIKEVVLVSIAGNVLDFGYRDDYDSPDYLTREFENIIEEGLGYDDTDRMEEILKDGQNVVYFTDNAGEIVFDTLLMKKIKEYDVHLSVMVKGEPILTDATMEDALEYGIDKIADQLDTTGGYAVGVDFDILPDNIEEKLTESDLIICKGMANWESFSESDYSPVAYLTRSKCHPVADSMEVPYEVNVAKLFE